MNKIFIGLFFLALSFLGGCGQSGRLYLPAAPSVVDGHEVNGKAGPHN